MKAKRFGSIVVVIWLLLVVPAISVYGQSQSPNDVFEGAKKEGMLVWYTTVSIEQSQFFLKEFEKKYPFIKTDLYRAVSNKILNKALTDKNAGKVFADVVSMGGFQSYFLKKKGLTAPYRSPETEIVPAQFKDPEGHWGGALSEYERDRLQYKNGKREGGPQGIQPTP